MNEREYKRLKRQIEGEYQQKLDALGMVWRMSSTSRNGSYPTDRSTSGAAKKGSLRAAIKAIVANMNGEFTMRDVIRKMGRDDPQIAKRLKPNYVSMALKRLADETEIFLVAVGGGKRPSRYSLEKPIVELK